MVEKGLSLKRKDMDSWIVSAGSTAASSAGGLPAGRSVGHTRGGYGANRYIFCAPNPPSDPKKKPDTKVLRFSDLHVNV